MHQVKTRAAIAAHWFFDSGSVSPVHIRQFTLPRKNSIGSTPPLPSTRHQVAVALLYEISIIDDDNDEFERLGPIPAYLRPGKRGARIRCLTPLVAAMSDLQERERLESEAAKTLEKLK